MSTTVTDDHHHRFIIGGGGNERDAKSSSKCMGGGGSGSCTAAGFVFGTTTSSSKQTGVASVKIDHSDLVKEMNELSFEERERVFDDIHGVGEIIEETPEFVNRCIEELDRELKRISSKRKKNYSHAMFLCPKLLHDINFKLMFLRAEEFNPKLASERIVRHFDFRHEYFGSSGGREQNLVKRITIDDLSDVDLDVIRLGHLVLLPMKDQIGRPVIFSDQTKVDYKRFSLENMLRAYYYITGSAMDDTAQKKGVCCFIYSNKHSYSNLVKNLSRPERIRWFKSTGYMTKCLPCRFTNFQICHDATRAEFLLNLLRATLQRHTRLRLRTHVGSDMEHDYFLLSLGTKAQRLIQNASIGNHQIHEEYLKRRRDIDRKQDRIDEEQEVKSNLASFPKPNDVLIGRGITYQRFPGNVHWANMIHQDMNRYADATTFEKTIITMQLVQKVKDSNGRFLQPTQYGWQRLDDSEARLKAASAFRTRMRPSSSNALSNTKRQRLD